MKGIEGDEGCFEGDEEVSEATLEEAKKAFHTGSERTASYDVVEGSLHGCYF